MRTNIIVLTLSLLLSILSIPVSGCILTIEPAQFNIQEGETIQFTAYRQQTCGRCVLPLEETQIIITNGTLLEKQLRSEGRGSTFSFTVKFKQAGDAGVQIIRDCPRRYNTVISNGTVKKIIKPSPVPQTTPIKNTTDTLHKLSTDSAVKPVKTSFLTLSISLNHR